PFHLTTREFVQLVHDRLDPGGVVVVNVIGAVRGDGSKLLRSVYRTYRTVFPTVLVHPVSGPDAGVQNVILVATDQAAPDTSFLLRRWRSISAAHPLAPPLTSAIPGRYDEPLPLHDVPVLSDDYAPTDALLVP
ncbi:MAG TPA: fused MFS/spermidine synthase, partial [Gaiellaceae bacterium]|nr:fused MFS/spermidine synthase [Gaiellaceae bacterium]